MRTILSTNFVDTLKGTTVVVNERHIVVTGPRGKLERTFRHANLEIKMVKANKMRVDAWFANRKELAVVRTICTHVKNMMIGVTQGYQYKMRAVYAHFPINLTLSPGPGGKDTAIDIRNFLGEKIVRRVECHAGVKLSLSKDVKDEIVLEGNAVEAVSLTAALIQQICDVKNKDIRKFLDGIYVSEKGNITAAEEEEE